MKDKPECGLACGSKLWEKVYAQFSFLAMVIQNEAGRPLREGKPQAWVNITRGSGTIELEEQASIPAGVNTINVFIPLFSLAQAANKTGTMALKSSGEAVVRYKVR